jgi:hypothetical protein
MYRAKDAEHSSCALSTPGLNRYQTEMKMEVFERTAVYGRRITPMPFDGGVDVVLIIFGRGTSFVPIPQTFRIHPSTAPHGI